MASSPSILKRKYKENPFVKGSNFVLPMRNRTERLETSGPLHVTDSATGESMDVAQISRVRTVDSEKFVKLYVAQLHAFFDLKPGTHRLMMALIDELSQARYMNGDQIYLNYNKVVDYFERNDTKPPAKATFFGAMAEMTEKGFVAPSVDTNLWFINPAIFFNGDRVKFVTELRRKRQSKQEQLEDAGQQRLALDAGEE